MTNWVTGHSRGGALANLVAAKLIDNDETVFAYTFAAPATTACTQCETNGYSLNGPKQCVESSACAVHADKYSSIFNIVNEDDFIPYFPLKQWYFTRYGRSTKGVKIDGSQTSYSTLWTNSWEDHEGNALETQYVHMESPDAPLDEFYQVASQRNSCYYYNEEYELQDTAHYAYIPLFPSNTAGYYGMTYLGSSIVYVRQKPMFLMKYFVAVAAKQANEIVFALSPVAPYLLSSKIHMLAEVVGIATEDVSTTDWNSVGINTIRMEHPHLPQSYCLLTMQISNTSFN